MKKKSLVCIGGKFRPRAMKKRGEEEAEKKGYASVGKNI